MTSSLWIHAVSHLVYHLQVLIHLLSGYLSQYSTELGCQWYCPVDWSVFHLVFLENRHDIYSLLCTDLSSIEVLNDISSGLSGIFAHFLSTWGEITSQLSALCGSRSYSSLLISCLTILVFSMVCPLFHFVTVGSDVSSTVNKVWI